MAKVHCKACDGAEYESVSALRIHQRKDHPEFWAKRTPKLPAVKMEHPRELVGKQLRAMRNGTMSVDDLLEELESQRQFYSDVISMIEGMKGAK